MVSIKTDTSMGAKCDAVDWVERASIATAPDGLGVR